MHGVRQYIKVLRPAPNSLSGIGLRQIVYVAGRQRVCGAGRCKLKRVSMEIELT